MNPFPRINVVQGDHRQEKLLTRKEAAEYLGVAPQTLAKWKCNGRHALPVIQFARTVRYRKSDLDAFIDDSVVVKASNQ